jgi:hypothetical protein
MITTILIIGYIICIVFTLIYTNYEHTDVSKQMQHESNEIYAWLSCFLFGFLLGYLYLASFIITLIYTLLKERFFNAPIAQRMSNSLLSCRL